jgi:thiol-disulfide isomerase/thioredoxin
MMRRCVPVLAAIVVASGAVPLAAGQAPGDAALIPSVRAAVAKQDFPAGERLVEEYRTGRGVTSEAAEAVSWLARGALGVKDLNRAEQYAADAEDLALKLLPTTSVDRDRHLEIALGAAIEVQALVKAARGARADAVYLLKRALEAYGETALHKRLQKNINDLSLEGQPALTLDAAEHLGPPVPTFDELKGKVVLLFFWAHWCPDCKAESPIIAKLLDKYRAQGLAVVAPTQRFGYVVSGRPAPPDEELRHIISVRDTYYGFLQNEAVPLSEANHLNYGVSSTPTLVLVDRAGIVRVYNPGRMTEEELEAAIRALL